MTSYVAIRTGLSSRIGLPSASDYNPGHADRHPGRPARPSRRRGTGQAAARARPHPAPMAADRQRPGPGPRCPHPGLHRVRSLAIAPRRLCPGTRPAAGCRTRPAAGRRTGRRRPGVAGRTGPPGTGHRPSHPARPGPDGPARCRDRRAAGERPAAVRRHRLRGRTIDGRPLAPAPAGRPAAPDRQPAGGGRPAPERLVAPGRRNATMAPVAQRHPDVVARTPGQRGPRRARPAARQCPVAVWRRHPMDHGGVRLGTSHHRSGRAAPRWRLGRLARRPGRARPAPASAGRPQGPAGPARRTAAAGRRSQRHPHPETARGLLGWLPAPKKNWSAWWSHPA